MSQLPGNDGTATRVDVVVRRRSGRIAGEANLIAAGMAGVVVVQTANDGPPVHDAAGQGQEIAFAYSFEEGDAYRVEASSKGGELRMSAHRLRPD